MLEEWNLWDLYNCEPVFQYECPLQWEHLRQTKTPGVRFCEACEKLVYFCSTPEEFVRQGELGRCVAIAPELTIKRELVPKWRDDSDRRIPMGLVDYTPMIKAEKTRMAFWAEVLKLNPDLPHELVTLDDASVQVEEFRQREIDQEKKMAEYAAELDVLREAERVRLERQVRVQAELARIAGMSNQEAWDRAGNCPKCGFSHRWDGSHCSHCGHPHCLPD
ncbi:hypothetical protein NA78x_001696 [Anatilimnocola sp. NA78]|uniref:hypothetical protein n=1 Tax=Anatilimnocola sp. NA78 TaxID=3415683 RepID=UPI003CE51F36